MYKTICIISPFENCGATATAINLAAGIAVLEYRCLLLDFDPARTAIRALRPWPFPFLYPPVRPITEPENIKESILPTVFKYLNCIPADMIGQGVLKKIPEPESENRDFQENMSSEIKPLFEEFDFIVQHFPSASNTIDFTDISAPDHILIPIDHDRLKIERSAATSNRLDLFFEAVTDKHTGTHAQTQILITRSPSDLSSAEIISKAGMVAPGRSIGSIHIPNDDAVRKGTIFGESVFLFDITAPAAAAFLTLASILAEKLCPSVEPEEPAIEKDTADDAFFRKNEVVYRKTLVDARREMIRRLSEGIDLDALKAELLKKTKTTCNDKLKFLSGDFVSHDNEPAFRLDFQYNGLWSVTIGVNGEIFSIIETPSPDEKLPEDGSGDTSKENPIAQKLAELMSEINQ